MNRRTYPQHPAWVLLGLILTALPGKAQAQLSVSGLKPVEVDEAAVAAAGIRKLAGKRLVLYTDLPSSPAVDELPEVFDQAFPQWCKYFGVNARLQGDWQMRAFLMKDKALFEEHGLLPEQLPAFKNGFAVSHDLWLYEQPSDYYRRHLLLHEGTHGFMFTLLGSCGPPWYMEGTAELLATHRWRDGQLALNHMPQSRTDTPYWGRIRMIKDALADGRGLYLRQVLDYSADAHLENEAYAWCWAAATLLDRHPDYQKRFRKLGQWVRKPDFNRRFDRLFDRDADALAEQWQVFITGIEYGYDMAASAIDFTPGKVLPSEETEVTISAERGWQNAGVRLEAGTAYRLEASGRYQVADQPKPWWCEPGGISITYYQGHPLGILQAAVRPANKADRKGRSSLLKPVPIGLGTTLTPKHTGTLYLRINDSAAQLGDNAGELTVKIRPK